MTMTTKKIYYRPRLDFINPPISTYLSDFKIKTNAVNKCPAWNHKNSRIFVVYSPVNLKIEFGEEDLILSSDEIPGDDLKRFIAGYEIIDNSQRALIEIINIFSNFYWTQEKNVWLSVQSHPLTSLNNNFYHCGAWFNLSNWNRTVNIGGIVVDITKPVTIKKGDPLYTIQFHTENQNDQFQLIEEKGNGRIIMSESGRRVSEYRTNNIPYDNISFESEKKSKCPFSFLWKKE